MANQKVKPIQWTGPGCPIWTGPPDQHRIRVIYSLTMGDSYKPRRYYRRSVNSEWRRLESPESYADLNALVDRECWPLRGPPRH